MAEKVQPEGVYAFKKPITFHNKELDKIGVQIPPLTAYDETYVKRQQGVEEKFFTCKSGRKFCYFTEGPDPSKADIPVVLCLHGSSASKWFWLMPYPFQDIFLIAPDRFGMGKSSSTPEDSYSFADGCPEFLELVDHVYAEKNIPKEKKFFVTGHSMGGTWTYSMASCPEVCERIEAIAPVCGPADVRHPQFPKKDQSKADPFFGMKKKGCGGAWSRFIIKKFSLPYLVCPAAGGQKIDEAAKYKQFRDNCGGDERGKGALDASPFFVTSCIDVNRGHNTKADALVEFTRCYAEPWSYDPANIKVPCFIYNGEKECVPLCFAEHHHKVIQGSELTVWPGHTEVTITIELERIIKALVKKQKVEGGPSFPV